MTSNSSSRDESACEHCMTQEEIDDFNENSIQAAIVPLYFTEDEQSFA